MVGDMVKFRRALTFRNVPLTPLQLGGAGGRVTPDDAPAALFMSFKLVPGRPTDASGTRMPLLESTDDLPWALLHGAGTTACTPVGSTMIMRRAPQLRRGKARTMLAVPSKFGLSLVTAGSVSMGARAAGQAAAGGALQAAAAAGRPSRGRKRCRAPAGAPPGPLHPLPAPLTTCTPRPARPSVCADGYGGTLTTPSPTPSGCAKCPDSARSSAVGLDLSTPCSSGGGGGTGVWGGISRAVVGGVQGQPQARPDWPACCHP
jgi:hypothetical protein